MAVPTQAADVLVVQAVTLLGGRIVCMEKIYTILLPSFDSPSGTLLTWRAKTLKQSMVKKTREMK